MNTSFLDNQQNRNYLALALIGLGVFFLADQVFGFINIGGKLWPFFVIVPGLIFTALALSGDRKKLNFIFPATIVTGTGLILLYQSITGHWESWAYMWALYPGFVGFAMRFKGERRDKPKDVEKGTEMMRWSLLAFIGGFFLFEVIIFGGFSSWLPVVLIGGGLLILASKKRDEKSKVHFYANGTSKRKNDEEKIY